MEAEHGEPDEVQQCLFCNFFATALVCDNCLQQESHRFMDMVVDVGRQDGTEGRFNFRRTSLTGFPSQSISSSNTIALDSPNLLVLNTGASQSRQHGFPFITVNTKEYHSKCSGNYRKDNA
uniref:Uncharacterized protein n=1 Tax=Tanacetum cinerariifolium TaxID=118510 RepID=A0A6L2NUR5_TANCI|nr:hypothetical protein [Tanacetum cinerariifolium]